MDRFNQLIEMLEKDPNDSFLQFALAKEYEKKNDFNTAIKTYQALIEIDQEYTGAYYHLAKAFEIIEEFQLALKTYDLGIEKASNQKDFFSLSELNSAKQNLLLEL